MAQWPGTPAVVIGRGYDVLAANPLADVLFDGFAHRPNLLVKLFLDPDARIFYPDWEQVARYTVAGFRLLQGQSPDDPRIRQVVEQLSAASPEFVEMWVRHEAPRQAADQQAVPPPRSRRPHTVDQRLRRALLARPGTGRLPRRARLHQRRGLSPARHAGRHPTTGSAPRIRLAWAARTEPAGRDQDLEQEVTGLDS